MSGSITEVITDNLPAVVSNYRSVAQQANETFNRYRNSLMSTVIYCICLMSARDPYNDSYYDGEFEEEEEEVEEVDEGSYSYPEGQEYKQCQYHSYSLHNGYSSRCKKNSIESYDKKNNFCMKHAVIKSCYNKIYHHLERRQHASCHLPNYLAFWVRWVGTITCFAQTDEDHLKWVDHNYGKKIAKQVMSAFVYDQRQSTTQNMTDRERIQMEYAMQNVMRKVIHFMFQRFECGSTQRVMSIDSCPELRRYYHTLSTHNILHFIRDQLQSTSHGIYMHDVFFST